MISTTKEDYTNLLRALELEAYAGIVSAFRTQGSFNSYKELILEHLRKALNISWNRHISEVRRATFDETLTTLAERLNPVSDANLEWIKACGRPAKKSSVEDFDTTDSEHLRQVADNLDALASKHNLSLESATSVSLLDALKLPPKKDIPEYVMSIFDKHLSPVRLAQETDEESQRVNQPKRRRPASASTEDSRKQQQTQHTTEKVASSSRLQPKSFTNQTVPPQNATEMGHDQPKQSSTSRGRGRGGTKMSKKSIDIPIAAYQSGFAQSPQSHQSALAYQFQQNVSKPTAKRRSQVAASKSVVASHDASSVTSRSHQQHQQIGPSKFFAEQFVDSQQQQQSLLALANFVSNLSAVQQQMDEQSESFGGSVAATHQTPFRFSPSNEEASAYSSLIGDNDGRLKLGQPQQSVGGYASFSETQQQQQSSLVETVQSTDVGFVDAVGEDVVLATPRLTTIKDLDMIPAFDLLSASSVSATNVVSSLQSALPATVPIFPRTSEPTLVSSGLTLKRGISETTTRASSSVKSAVASFATVPMSSATNTLGATTTVAGPVKQNLKTMFANFHSQHASKMTMPETVRSSSGLNQKVIVLPSAHFRRKLALQDLSTPIVMDGSELGQFQQDNQQEITASNVVSTDQTYLASKTLTTYNTKGAGSDVIVVRRSKTTTGQHQEVGQQQQQTFGQQQIQQQLGDALSVDATGLGSSATLSPPSTNPNQE